MKLSKAASYPEGVEDVLWFVAEWLVEVIRKRWTHDGPVTELVSCEERGAGRRNQVQHMPKGQGQTATYLPSLPRKPEYFA